MSSARLTLVRDRLRRRAGRVMRVANARFDESDLVQEALLATLQRGLSPMRSSVESGIAVGGLIREAFVDLLRAHVRCEKRSIRREVILASDRSSACDHDRVAKPDDLANPALLIERRELLQKLMSTVSKQDREIIRWRCIDRLTSAEIADRLGISTSAASKRYVRALSAVRAAAHDWDDAVPGPKPAKHRT